MEKLMKYFFSFFQNGFWVKMFLGNIIHMNRKSKENGPAALDRAKSMAVALQQQPKFDQ